MEYIDGRGAVLMSPQITWNTEIFHFIMSLSKSTKNAYGTV
jgi:hypothetical protein